MPCCHRLQQLGGIVIAPTSGLIAQTVGWPVFFLISAALSLPGLDIALETASIYRIP